MTRVEWDAVRSFTSGLDRGVFYPTEGAGVPWNGLISVDDGSNNEAPTAIYMDGRKVFNAPSQREFTANLTAYTYPEEFEAYNGFETITDGVYFDERLSKPFGMSYRTMLEDGEYRIHLLYGVIATPSASTYNTMTNQGAATAFSWALVTTSQIIPGYQATSHVIVDSREVDQGVIDYLENIIYGSETRNPRLPSVGEVADLSAETQPVVVTDLVNGQFSLSAPSYYLTISEDGEYEFSGPTHEILTNGRFMVESEEFTY